MLAAAKGLKLQSVLSGRTPTAMISNNVLTVGQTISGWTVAEIHPRYVVLTWETHKFELRMGS
jgi:hypothetical protein